MSETKRISKKKNRLLEKLKAKQRNKRAKRQKQLINIPTILAKIDELIDEFEYEEAVKWVRTGLELFPNNTVLLEKGGMATLEAGLTDEAYTYFCRAVDISPDIGSSKYLYLGQLCDSQEAINYLSKGIKLLTEEGKSIDTTLETSSAYCSLAEIYLTDECFSESADSECYKCCQKAVSCCPTNPEGYQVMASYLLSKHKPEESCSILLKGVNLWLPSDDEGSDTSSSEPQREGIVDGEDMAAISDDKNNDDDNDLVPIPAYYSRINCAKLLLEVEQYKTAEQILSGLVREDNEVLAAWYLLGWCQYLSGDYTASRICLDSVIELSKKFESDEHEVIAHSQELLKEIEEKKHPNE